MAAIPSLVARLKKDSNRTKGYLPTDPHSPNLNFYKHAISAPDLQTQIYYSQCVFHGGKISNTGKTSKSPSFYSSFLHLSNADYITKDIVEGSKSPMQEIDVSNISTKSESHVKSVLNTHELVEFSQTILDMSKDFDLSELKILAYFLRKAKLSWLLIDNYSIEITFLKSLLIEQEQLAQKLPNDTPSTILAIQLGINKNTCISRLAKFAAKKEVRKLLGVSNEGFEND